jgi:pyruvate dehydrogenase E2 component (dihydrolipoamide acetyltransferase)
VNSPYTVKTLSPMRKAIAARTMEAKQSIPHFRLVADVEIDALLRVRQKLRERRATEPLSLNDLLIKACASALIENPAVNVQWVNNEIREFRAADLSVVIALEDGLSTPIIRSAESKSIWDISREMRDLSSRAARNALKMTEIIGGSFSLSNLGMYDVDQFDAIINPPQCAILAVGAGRPRVLASTENGTRIATVLRITLSVDHRGIDGVTAARFMSAFKRRLEMPEQMQLERTT